MKRELFDYLDAARFTTNEFITTLMIVVMTLFFHLVFTIVLHFA